MAESLEDGVVAAVRHDRVDVRKQRELRHEGPDDEVRGRISDHLGWGDEDHLRLAVAQRLAHDLVEVHGPSREDRAERDQHAIAFLELVPGKPDVVCTRQAVVESGPDEAVLSRKIELRSQQFACGEADHEAIGEIRPRDRLETDVSLQLVELRLEPGSDLGPLRSGHPMSENGAAHECRPRLVAEPS